MNNASQFTICHAEEDITNPTLDAELSQLPPIPCMERMPEPATVPAPETTAEPIISPASPASPLVLPSLFLPPPLLKTASSLAPLLLDPFSSLALLSTSLCCMDPPRVFWSPAIPLGQQSPPLHLGPSTSRFHFGFSTAQLHLDLLPLQLHWDSLVLPATPWSVAVLPVPQTSKPSAALYPSTPSGSAFPLATAWFLVPPTVPQSSGTLAPPRLLICALAYTIFKYIV